MSKLRKIYSAGVESVRRDQLAFARAGSPLASASAADAATAFDAVRGSEGDVAGLFRMSVAAMQPPLIDAALRDKLIAEFGHRNLNASPAAPLQGVRLSRDPTSPPPFTHFQHTTHILLCNHLGRSIDLRAQWVYVCRMRCESKVNVFNCFR